MKKRFIVVGISVLLAVTFVTAFSAFAERPFRAAVLAQIYGGDGTSAYRPLSILPVNNSTFGIYSNTTYEVATRINFTFTTDVDISSFAITLKLLSSAWSINFTSTSSAYTQLFYYNGTSTTAGVSVASNTTVVKDQDNNSVTWMFSGSYDSKNAFNVSLVLQSSFISTTPVYFEIVSLSVNGEDAPLSYTEEALNNMMNYDSQGGSPDTEGASELVESITDDVNNINNTIQQHTPHVQNWFETSPVAGDLVNIALLANSWLPAYLNCDPDVSFYWGLVTFCILLTLIENGLRRRPWHGFDDGGDFESEYDVTSTDEKGRSRTIHNKVSGSRRRVR